MTVYHPKFSHHFQLAAMCSFTSYPKPPHNVTPWSVHQLQNLSLSLSTDRRHQCSVPDLSCRVPITSSCEGIGIRFLVAKCQLGNLYCLKIWVYLAHLAFYLESFQGKNRKRTSHHANGLKHLQNSFFPPLFNISLLL